MRDRHQDGVWRNATPPKTQRIDKVRSTVTVTIPIGKIILGIVIILGIWLTLH